MLMKKVSAVKGRVARLRYGNIFLCREDIYMFSVVVPAPGEVRIISRFFYFSTCRHLPEERKNERYYKLFRRGAIFRKSLRNNKKRNCCEFYCLGFFRERSLSHFVEGFSKDERSDGDLVGDPDLLLGLGRGRCGQGLLTHGRMAGGLGRRKLVNGGGRLLQRAKTNDERKDLINDTRYVHLIAL